MMVLFPGPARLGKEYSLRMRAGASPANYVRIRGLRGGFPQFSGGFVMIRAAKLLVALALFLAVAWCPMYRQGGGATDVQNYFQGKQVQLKIDMPGTQQGVDLRFDRGTPMDWKQYSSRLKKFGVAIPKDERATVTTVVVKKDMIEFQLDGGGFGTFGDDTNTTVEAKSVEKSSYEKQLERDIANTDD